MLLIITIDIPAILGLTARPVPVTLWPNTATIPLSKHASCVLNTWYYIPGTWYYIIYTLFLTSGFPSRAVIGSLLLFLWLASIPTNSSSTAVLVVDGF